MGKNKTDTRKRKVGKLTDLSVKAKQSAAVKAGTDTLGPDNVQKKHVAN